MTEDEKDAHALADIIQEQADGCFRRSAERGPTPEGARWLLTASILYYVVVAMKRRPDRLEDMALALRGVIGLSPMSVARMMAEVRKKGSCN